MDKLRGGLRARMWMRRASNGMFRRLRSSDGRIKIATLSGVSVLVIVIGLAVGVLPAIATGSGESGAGVNPAVVKYGGGSGACSANIDDRLPSAAAFELHINNPKGGTFTGPDGTEITINAHKRDTLFDFTVDTEGATVYDVVVNGGRHNTHYDYDGNGGPGMVTSDSNLHAPAKVERFGRGRGHRRSHNWGWHGHHWGGHDRSGEYFKLSHINICYDVAEAPLFACDTPVALTNEGLLTNAEATIFANAENDCEDQQASFVIKTEGETPIVELKFEKDEGEGSDPIAGRLDITKDFDDPDSFVDLQYDGPGAFVDVQWCTVRDKVEGDGDEFDDVLAEHEYPSLDDVEDQIGEGSQPATACKVYEEENAAGIQHTVVYFEFVDPNFR